MTTTMTAFLKRSRRTVATVLADVVGAAPSSGAGRIRGGNIGALSNDLFNGSVEVVSRSLAIGNLLRDAVPPAFGVPSEHFGGVPALRPGFIEDAADQGSGSP